MLLSTHVKFAPFATRFRRGYLRDVSERDLAGHLDTALRGVILNDRWPKSGVEVIVTILEGEEDTWWGEEVRVVPDPVGNGVGGSGLMSILSACITVSSAAIIDAGIDCVDIVSGGVAALIRQPMQGVRTAISTYSEDTEYQVILDPTPSQHSEILACCTVGYLKSRDELTEVWIQGKASSIGLEETKYLGQLIDGAVQAAIASNSVITQNITEG
jgi:exosome complex component MTR3